MYVYVMPGGIELMNGKGRVWGTSEGSSLFQLRNYFGSVEVFDKLRKFKSCSN